MPERGCSPSTGGNGRKGSRRRASSIRHAPFTVNATRSFSTDYVVVPIVENFTGSEINVRFEGLSGRIDQGAGILFNLKPNGDYLTVRANCLENNLVL